MCVVNKIYVSSVVRTVSSFERFQNFVQESRVEFRPKSEGLLFYEPRLARVSPTLPVLVSAL
jgi:hypothetical protein